MFAEEFSDDMAKQFEEAMKHMVGDDPNLVQQIEQLAAAAGNAGICPNLLKVYTATGNAGICFNLLKVYTLAGNAGICFNLLTIGNAGFCFNLLTTGNAGTLYLS